jgi:hypothetical protein
MFVLVASGTAFANFGPHGMYTTDTDGCAACHRAHTSFSSLTWTGGDGSGPRSALLISNASEMTDFCYACHGDGAQGASTNVQSGIFDSGPTTGMGDATSSTLNPATFYVSNSSYNATLNAGGFELLGAAKPIMSAHDMKGLKVGTNPVPWGYLDPSSGSSSQNLIGSFRCTSCHDPHGSSNYRLLKDNVNGWERGGYNLDGSPKPWVISNEENYPPGGFKKGEDGYTDQQLQPYRPNYTSPQYSQYQIGKNMSGWCSGCHTAYASQDSTYTYLSGMGDGILNSVETTFHRHPIDVSVLPGRETVDADRALRVRLEMDDGLPLEMAQGLSAVPGDYTAKVPWDERGNVTCLTCHFAHGSAATMSGWAVAKLTTNTAGDKVPQMLPSGETSLVASLANPLGVNPAFSQSLLRYDNRGVCERCHNK